MKKKLCAILLILGLLVISAAGVLLCNAELRQSLQEAFLYPECPENPETGKWYRITPKDAISADGTKWSGRIRFGDEDKLLIYLLGGGVVLDDFSAAQSYAAVGSKAFYYGNDLGVSSSRLKSGIASDQPQNPFRDWTVLLVPYTTGDFHIGSGKSIVRHNGYSNFMTLLDAARGHLAQPEQLLIAGYSAGGFGAAMLAEDILACFPNAENTALCIDSALLLNKNWDTVARELWHAPEHIAARISGENLTLDHLCALNGKYPEVKILFASSVRDGGLAKFQSYIDGGAYETTSAGGERYAISLKNMVSDMQNQLQDVFFYLWDDDAEGKPTRHTMLYREDFFSPLSDETSMAEWIYRVLDGEKLNCGLALLQCLQ